MVSFKKASEPVVQTPIVLTPVGIMSAGVTKQLTVRLIDRNSPEYTFQGEWIGRDIMLIGRTIARAYRKEQLAKRRANGTLVSENQAGPTTMEESNA